MGDYSYVTKNYNEHTSFKKLSLKTQAKPKTELNMIKHKTPLLRLGLFTRGMKPAYLLSSGMTRWNCVQFLHLMDP